MIIIIIIIINTFVGISLLSIEEATCKTSKNKEINSGCFYVIAHLCGRKHAVVKTKNNEIQIDLIVARFISFEEQRKYLLRINGYISYLNS